jgi:hypothetical protein
MKDKEWDFLTKVGDLASNIIEGGVHIFFVSD